jgi:ATP-dependent DNA helicase RecG
MKAWMTKALELLKASLEPPVALDHAMEDYESVRLLFVHVPESAVKPVHPRGKGLEDAFIRSGGTTRKASRQEIGTLMLNSRTLRWEELHASVLLPDTEFATRLNVEPIYKMLERPAPATPEETMAWMAGERFIAREPAGGGYIRADVCSRAVGGVLPALRIEALLR